ncbi:hypothetical protein AYX22_23560 (plasmid) [Arthrobacter sp. D5-1]|nr:hypothetical protein AYX22_23560 [Arthrobacter sp. D5-1]
MLEARAEAGPVGFPSIVDPYPETVCPVKETAGLGAVTVEPQDLIIVGYCIDNSAADLLIQKFHDDQLANQRLPFGLQVKCHLIPCPFLWSGLCLPSLGQAQPLF